MDYPEDRNIPQEHKSKHKLSWMFWKSRRYVVSALAFFGFFTAWALRINLSIALVAMTELKNMTLQNGSIVSIREFDWDSKTQGFILSSFFYGYITTQIPGGYLAARIGGKIVLGLGIGVTALLTLITPWVAKTNLYLFIAVRIIEGVFEGVTYPCVHAIWGKWAPPFERSRLAMTAFSGGCVGMVVSLPVSSLLCTSFGWESVFYSYGVFGLLWSLTWMLVVAESPEKDQKISAEELKYITESLGGCEPITKLKVPWGAFATSAPVWAISLANFSENWGGYTLVTQLPKFMKSVLKFDLNEAGFMSCLPYLGNSISVPIAGYLADLCIVRSSFSTTQIRKAFNYGGFIGQTVFLLTPIFLWEPTGTVICITVAQSLGAFAMAGFNVNHLDLGPQYASILMGIANTFGTVPGIISPIVAGYIVTDENRVYQWRIIFYVSSAVYLFGAIMYGTFASCELQPWATKVEYSRSNNNKHESIEKQGGSYENESFQKEIE